MRARTQGGGHPQGVPLRLDNEGAPTQGGKGTHKGCPCVWIMRARAQGGGRPQGVPLRLDNEGARTGGKGTHKGCPCVWIMRARAQGGGHPQGVPLRLDNEGAPTQGGRAPTRGAPTGTILVGSRHLGCAALLRLRRMVGEACFWRGALRGESPRTREGRRPDRPNGRQTLAASAQCHVRWGDRLP